MIMMTMVPSWKSNFGVEKSGKIPKYVPWEA